MKILIIKFAALGDVLRTTPLLTALKRRYRGCSIDWLTHKGSLDILKNNRLIDRIYTYSKETAARLRSKNYDILISLDKDRAALQAAGRIGAKVKKGFTAAAGAAIAAFDKDSRYACRLGVDDDLKFRKNKKTYQQISFEQAGVVYKGQSYIYEPDATDKRSVERRLAGLGLKKASTKIGITTGAGSGFCGKSLPEDYYIRIIERFSENADMQILLLGGPKEASRNRRMLKAVGPKVIDTGCDNSISEYAAIVGLCDIVLTGDTLTMHLGIALKKQVVVFFGSTAQQEIDLYGRGIKLLPRVRCSPCYRKRCSIGERCMREITPKRIIRAIERFI